jgi:hypothetical protein
LSIATIEYNLTLRFKVIFVCNSMMM